MGRAAKMLVNAGRAKEIVSLYDGEGVMRMSRRSPVSLSDRTFEDGPTVAAALRAVGRTDEADRVLQQLDAELNRALRRSGGRAPSWFFALAARTWALRGKADAAMDALDRAMANGWAYSTSELDDSSLADFGDEPAFRSLRGNPRFEGIRARINAHLMTERREAFAQLGSTI